jgi:hypothetical protein
MQKRMAKRAGKHGGHRQGTAKSPDA